MPGTVTVACSLPHGFQLQLQEKVLIPAPSREDANRKEQISRHVGKPITINGPARNRDPKRMASGNTVLVVGNYALTPGVDKDTWDKFAAQMADWPPLAAGQVFARERDDHVRGHARAGDAGPSGFEPFDPKNMPDEFKGRNGKNLIEPHEKQ